ncbi:MAG: D-alanyl-D-alanine carboxypeptidase [Alphaproteobacteria bacterium]|nr:D-alanyl-D-alanine carboxypeptidase [Alphaproteobacteria bacterium]
MKIQKIFLFILMLALVLCPHAALAKKHHHTAHHARPKHHHVCAGVDRGAGYADIVIDAETGRIIHATNADSLRHPASLTKMMTLYLTFQALETGRLSLGDYLPVSENASYQEPTKLGLRAGQRIRVQDAILGIVTESANDAAMVMGEALGGSEQGFAQLMTRQARAMGMTQTRFDNPTGLPDPAQVTTAHDMAILGAALIEHYPQFYPYFHTEGFTYAGVFHHNHNHLMDRYAGMDGIKTGYIRASGFNLVASVKRGNLRLIAAMFGGRSAVARDNRMAHLLDQSFAEAQKDARIGRVASAKGEGDSSDDGSEGYVTLPAKIAAVFPPHGEVATASPPRAQEAVQEPQQNPKHVMHLAVAQHPVVEKSVARGGWGVQIGAYSNPDIGKQALSALASSMPGYLANADPQVQKISAGGGTTMYRARLMSLDKNTAQSVCSYLTQRGKSCLTVGP